MLKDEPIDFNTTRHERMFESLLTTLTYEHWVVLQGEKGSGKSTLVRGMLAAWPHRVITICPVNSKGYRWELTVIADTQDAGNLTGRSFALASLWPELLHALEVMPGRLPLFVLEDGHRLTKNLMATVNAFTALMPTARLLLTGRFTRCQQRQLRMNHPVWFDIASANLKDFRQVMASHAGVDLACGNPFPDTFIRKIMKRSRGDLRLAARAGRFFYKRYEECDEPHALISHSQQHDALRLLPSPRRRGLLCMALIVTAAIWGSAGGYFSQPLSRWLPSPETLLPTSPAVKDAPSLVSHRMSSNESLALLYSVWGYEVDKSEAWCDQAYRAGMACVSGKENLASLMAQSLPWIATLEIDNASIPVVIIGEGEGAIIALSAGKTWLLDKAWFSNVWKGSYTLMWKPSPDGNASITKKSSIDDVAWLDTMLSRVLNVEAENTGEWSPMLTEKIRQFQTQNNIKADGVMGKVTLIRLWQVLGESPKLTHEGAKV
ncbi:ExeA family protein [unidentified bacterial endosymbiont]|uniref:ExeA family protein n=1 Tax=unidentified bacterial endosymbiont TaxID=2355 RepID=UPI00209E2539|nr:peptidoglycan-binding protein [unidentified bacterial endosymbiont]